MRIAQMLDTLYWGGAQRMQLFLVETLRPLGIEITVIDLSDSSDSPVPSILRAAGAEVVSYSFDVLFSPGEFLRLTKFLRAQKFDLLHTYLTYSNIVGPFAGKLSGTPVIASIRNADYGFKEYSARRKAIETFTLRYLADRIMPNGNAVAEFTNKRLEGSRHLDVIPNAVDTYPPLTEAERFILRVELVGDASRAFILSVGRLSTAKGFHDLLDAFAVVHSLHPEAALVIAGGGKMHEELQNHIHKLGLTDHAFLLGTRNDTLRLMAAADIYVNSSHWEGTPVTVLEAMAAGLPIVATNVGENRHLLASNAGIVVPPEEPASLAAAINRLLESKKLRIELGQAANERVKTHYSREIWRRKLLELYATVTPKAHEYLNPEK
jgi:glycosyltransferase involved in cell wall biosynthesis